MLQKKIRLGDLLVERGLITQEQLLAAIAVQKSDGTDRRLGHVLVDEGLISEEVILRTLADQLKAVYLEPGSFEGDVRLAKKLQAGVLKRALAVPVREERSGYLIAFADPLDLGAQDTIQRLLPDKPVIVAITAESEVLKIITRLETMEGLEETIEGVRREMRAENRNERDEAASSVVRLIEIIFTTAVTRGASDIHIEPSEAQCHVRGRIDGFLTELFVFDADIFPPLSSRIKLLGDLDIGERRKPQDGRFSHTVRGVEYDFRLSTLPVSGGESVVMRILDKSKALIRLSELGLNQSNLTRFREAMESPYGIVFVTGPTGSGKTTTLYAALNEIKNIERKIITVEDPIEYRMNLLQQVQVNEKAGMGFAGALRSILRQDPDVIMVGESRDKETIAIAIQAALTGHLVFTTLHTNDAISAITRVVDMGIEPFLVASSVVAIQAQRLVRRICPACKHAVKYPPELLERIAPHWPEDLGEITFYRGSGCKRCGMSGYQGRTMITEVLSFSDKLQEGIARGLSRGELLAITKSEGFEEMFTDGIRKVAAGESTLEEVMRVAKL